MKKEISAHLETASVGLILVLSTSLCVGQSKPAVSHRMISHEPAAASQLTRAAGIAPAASLNYTFTIINFPGAPETVAYGINPSATPSALQMAGSYGSGAAQGFG